MKQQLLEQLLEQQQQLSILDEEINNQKKKINEINKQISEYSVLKNSDNTLRTELYNIDCKNKRLVDHKIKLENDIKKIIDLIKDRARMKGTEPKTSNERTQKIDNDIDRINEEILQNEIIIFGLSNKISMLGNKNFIREKENEKNSINKMIEKLNTQYSKIYNDIEKLEGLILEEDMYRQYVEYAKYNNIIYDPEDDFDMYRQCNFHHHYKLLDGYKTYTKCHKSGRSCSEDVTLRVWNNNIVGECACGRGRWVEEDIPENLIQFNLNDEHIYGYMDWSGY